MIQELQNIPLNNFRDPSALFGLERILPGIINELMERQ